MTLDQHIEAVLFFKATPLSVKQLASVLTVSVEDITAALPQLKERLQQGATRVVVTNETIELVVASEFSEIIDSIRKDELRRDIGKAGAETLAIVLYRGPVSKVDIDRIRGVNSGFILRNLQIRGLIEKEPVGKGVQYKATTELYNHLGIQEKSALPEFTSIMNALDTYEAAQQTES